MWTLPRTCLKVASPSLHSALITPKFKLVSQSKSTPHQQELAQRPIARDPCWNDRIQSSRPSNKNAFLGKARRTHSVLKNNRHCRLVFLYFVVALVYLCIHILLEPDIDFSHTLLDDRMKVYWRSPGKKVKLTFWGDRPLSPRKLEIRFLFPAPRQYCWQA